MKLLLNILLLTCLASVAIAQQKPIYERTKTKTGQIGNKATLQAKHLLATPNYNLSTLPDSLKKEDPALLKYNYIGGSPRTTPIISANPAGWDQGIGEGGNVISVNDTLIMCYTGYHLPHVSNAVYVGMAISADNGATWAKEGPTGTGQILFTGNESEDPYVVNYQGTYYLFVEDKNAVPFRNIKMYTSADRLTWVDRGVVLDIGTTGSWDSQDVSSPTVQIKSDTFWLYFEGRQAGVGGQQGMAGLATAPISLTPTFTKNAGNPLIQGSNGTNITVPWGINIVPDDIISNDGKVYITAHIHNGTNFVEGVLTSSDGIHWADYLGSWLTMPGGREGNGSGVSLYFNGSEYVAHYLSNTDDGINEGYLMVQTSQSNGTKVGTFGGLNISQQYTLANGKPFSIVATNRSTNFGVVGASIDIKHTVAGSGGSLKGLDISVDRTTNTGALADTAINIKLKTGARAAGAPAVVYPGVNAVVTGSAATSSTATNLTYRGGYFEAKSLTAVGETSIVEGVHGKATGLSGMTTKGGAFEASGGTNNYGVDIVTGTLHLNPLTASKPLFLDASKNVTTTGPGTSSQLWNGAGALITALPSGITATTPTLAGQVAIKSYVDSLAAGFVVNATTTALSSATLNSTYPTAPIGYRVICGAITAGGAIYTKYAASTWLVTNATVQP